MPTPMGLRPPSLPTYRTPPLGETIALVEQLISQPEPTDTVATGSKSLINHRKTMPFNWLTLRKPKPRNGSSLQLPVVANTRHDCAKSTRDVNKEDHRRFPKKRSREKVEDADPVVEAGDSEAAVEEVVVVAMDITIASIDRLLLRFKRTGSKLRSWIWASLPSI